MLGGDRQLFRETVQAVESWIPSEAYGLETEFQKDLKTHLESELNSESRGDLGFGMNSEERVIKREYGTKVRGDIVIDETVGIEMKRDFSNDQRRDLSKQIEEYLEDYPYVIVCTCGIDDMDGWRQVKNEHSGPSGGFGMDSGEVKFIVKDPANYGRASGDASQDDGGLDPFSDLGF